MQALVQERAQASRFGQEPGFVQEQQFEERQAQMIATAQIPQQPCVLGSKDRLRPCCKSSRSAPAWSHPVRHLRPELSFPGQYWRQSARRC
jgi:hypothetical protein